MPGMDGLIPSDANLDDNELVKIEAIIQSFTKFEKADPNALVREPNRAKRIAAGSGSTDKAVMELVQKFLFMRQMMEGLGQNLGLMGKIPGMKNLAMAKNLSKMAGGGMPGMGGFPGMPGMPGMPPGLFGGGGFPGLGGFPGMPGMGGGQEGPNLTKMKQMSTAEKNAKKAQRKREKDARKKGRK
jgi:signal recognition particle subunit SRP54